MNKKSKLERRNGRMGSEKSKTGCITCKYATSSADVISRPISDTVSSRIRRVKCGEEKPECYRCTSTGRQCEYKRVIGQRQSQLFSSRMPSADVFELAIAGTYVSNIPDCSLELRAFEFFFQRSIPAFANANNASRPFWRTCVLQACHTEPIIWDAVRSSSESK